MEDKCLRQRGHSLVVKRYPSKLDMRVRFPLPAPFNFYPTDQQTKHPMKKYINSILITTALGVFGVNAEVDCIALSQSVTLEVTADSSKVLEIVSKEVAAAPSCSCEIVKAAIKASEAESKTVAAIVEAAISAAPDQMRLISQCAIATAPDAIGDVQAVLAKLDPNSGDSGISSKSSKSSKAPAGEVAAEDWNPLDFPGDENSTVGPPPGTDGGSSILPPGPQIDAPPAVDPVTTPDPSSN